VLVLGWLQAYTPHEISALQRNLKGADRS